MVLVVLWSILTSCTRELGLSALTLAQSKRIATSTFQCNSRNPSTRIAPIVQATFDDSSYDNSHDYHRHLPNQG